MNAANVCESCRFMRVTHPIVDDLPREAAEQAGHRPARASADHLSSEGLSR